MTDHACTHAAGKALHLLDRKEMAYTLQTPFRKAGYRPLGVQCLNSTQDSKILTGSFRHTSIICMSYADSDHVSMFLYFMKTGCEYF